MPVVTQCRSRPTELDTMKLLTMACSAAGRCAKGLKCSRLCRRFAAFTRCASSAPVEGATNEGLEPVADAEYDAL